MVVVRVSERYRVLWIGQVAVVTLPTEIDVTNANMVREELLSVLNRRRGSVVAAWAKRAFTIPPE